MDKELYEIALEMIKNKGYSEEEAKVLIIDIEKEADSKCRAMFSDWGDFKKDN